MGREVVAGEAVHRDIGDSKHARFILYAKEIGVPGCRSLFSCPTGAALRTQTGRGWLRGAGWGGSRAAVGPRTRCAGVITLSLLSGVSSPTRAGDPGGRLRDRRGAAVGFCARLLIRRLD